MGIKEQIKSDLKEAMRAKDVQKRDTLRNLSAAIKQAEIDGKKELSEAEIEAILAKYAKQREEAIKQFSDAGREDLVEKEKKELEIVYNYLPKPLSDEELQEAVKKVVEEVGATSMRDMGKIMGKIKALYGSRADGAKVNKIVKEMLG